MWPRWAGDSPGEDVEPCDVKCDAESPEAKPQGKDVLAEVFWERPAAHLPVRSAKPKLVDGDMDKQKPSKIENVEFTEIKMI